MDKLKLIEKIETLLTKVHEKMRIYAGNEMNMDNLGEIEKRFFCSLKGQRYALLLVLEMLEDC